MAPKRNKRSAGSARSAACRRTEKFNLALATGNVSSYLAPGLRSDPRLTSPGGTGAGPLPQAPQVVTAPRRPDCIADQQLEAGEVNSCPCGKCTRRRKKTAAQDEAARQVQAAFTAQLSPPSPEDLKGGTMPLACPDLPRSKAFKMMRDERDLHPKSTDWERPALASWHDAYDAMLSLWGAGHDIPAADFPAEAVKLLAEPGIYADKVMRGIDGEILDKITYKVAFVRVEDDKIIPLDDTDLRNQKDPYPGWDYELQGDPEQGRRLGELTKKHAVLIGTDEDTAALSHEASRALFHSPGYRAQHPELDGCRAVSRDTWRQARKRAVREGLMHKPEPDQHYRQGRRWHTISMPYAPGPKPGTPAHKHFISEHEDKRLVRRFARTCRRLTTDEARQQLRKISARA